MGRRLKREEVMTIGVLADRGMSRRGIARQLGVAESSVRYQLLRRVERAVDGRSKQVFLAAPCADAIATWMARYGEDGLNLAELHAWLVAEHDYTGSARSVQRYVRAKFPAPRLRTRRRVETPPGAQSQIDWSTWPGIRVAGERRDLFALHLVLSWSRMEAIVWSLRKHLLAWLSAHNGVFRRIGGVAAVARIDNERTAVLVGAGPTGQVHPTYAAYARALRFHVDLARPYAPGDKGKIERRIGDSRGWLDLTRREWSSLDELQAYTDGRVEERAHRRRCPATGTSVLEAFTTVEKPKLSPLPLLPEPFDLVAQRKVGVDATVRFEGRTYSVPFVYAGLTVELRGCARTVQALADGQVVAEHPRHTDRRILLEPAHYDGPGDDRVAAPVPLGRMGRRLAEIAAITPDARSVDFYAGLAEVSR